jgi:hypothetical protein
MKILIGCDVDPVLPPVLSERPSGNVWECLVQIDSLARSLGDDLPPVTWLIRVDQSVEFSTGNFLSGYVDRRALWDDLRSRGHEMGWHMHLMSYEPSRKQFTFDLEPDWLAEAHKQLTACFPVNATRAGWDYGSNFLLNALDSLDVKVDFSALPGNIIWFRMGGHTLVVDWRDSPATPYHPGARAYRQAGPDPLALLEIPITQFRRPWAGVVSHSAWRWAHGCYSTSGVRSMTRLLTDRWEELPLPAGDVWAFFFHPCDLTAVGIRNFRANLEKLRNLPNVQFKTATEVAASLSPREQQPTTAHHQ